MASLIRYEALARTMLDARSDVRSLTPLELLRLDYKEFNLLSAVTSNEAPSPARTIGVAAITLTLSELLALAGGAAGLEAAMAEAMCASNSAGAADVLFVITAAEGSSVGRKHLLALAAPTAEADARHGALLRAVASASSWLPERLATQPLFVAQAVPTEGFGVEWGALEGAPEGARLRYSPLRAPITRKTFLPVVKHACENKL